MSLLVTTSSRCHRGRWWRGDLVVMSFFEEVTFVYISAGRVRTYYFAGIFRAASFEAEILKGERDVDGV